jgi:hypothetical protein
MSLDFKTWPSVLKLQWRKQAYVVDYFINMKDKIDLEEPGFY